MNSSDNFLKYHQLLNHFHLYLKSSWLIINMNKKEINNFDLIIIPEYTVRKKANYS